MKCQLTESEPVAECASPPQRASVGHTDGASREAAVAVFRKWPTDFLGSTKSVISRYCTLNYYAFAWILTRLNVSLHTYGLKRDGQPRRINKQHRAFRCSCRLLALQASEGANASALVRCGYFEFNFPHVSVFGCVLYLSPVMDFEL